MKAKFFLLGLCALALAACSIDEVSQVNDTNAIQFKATTATRATATTTNNINEFTVWAWNGDNLFMDGVTASKSGSVFTTSPLYFWPTGSVDFYALTEVVEHGIFTGDDSQQHEYALLGGEISESGDGWTYTGNVAKAQVDNGTIVIDACIPSTPEEQIDICYGVALEKSSGSVPMNFRHALSQVAFKAKNVNTAFDVKIADVSVCSVYSEGVYTIGKNDTSDNLATADLGTSGISDSQGEWEVTEKDGYDVAIKSRYLVNLESSVVQLDDEGTVEDLVDPYGTLMLLPQEVVGWDPLTDATDTELGAYIRILCHVEESGSQLWPNNNEESEKTDLEGTGAFKTIGGEEYAEIAIPLEDIEWEQGYRYTYTIIFGEGLGYYPPDDPNYELDGTPVLVPITFKVTVDEFQDAEGAEVSTEIDLSEITVTTADELVGAARMGYEVINVENDITLTTYVEFTQDCVLNIAENATITAPNSTSKDDDAYIMGTTNCYSAAIYVTGGTLTINGGTVATTGGSESMYTEGIWVSGGTVIINSGTFKGGNWNDTSTGSESAVYVDPGAAYIYGGTFTSGNFRNGEHWAINCGNSSYKSGTAMIYCYGGTYTDGFNPADPNTDDAPSYVAEGYGVTYDSSANSYTVVYTKVTSAADLEALIAAGVSEITVTEDIVLTDQIRVGDDLVLNLEANLTKDSFEDNANTEQNFFFWVGGGATLTINASNDVVMSSGGTNGNDADDWVGCIQVGGNSGSGITTTGHLIINGGTYNGGVWDSSENYNSVATIYLLGGDVTVYDGIFTGGLSNSFKSYGYKADLKDYGENGLTECIFNIYDNSRTDPNDAWIYVYGGQFRNFDPSCNAVEGANTNFVVDGYKATKGEEDADGNIWFTVAETN